MSVNTLILRNPKFLSEIEIALQATMTPWYGKGQSDHIPEDHDLNYKY
jgi:hypothetical protein